MAYLDGGLDPYRHVCPSIAFSADPRLEIGLLRPDCDAFYATSHASAFGHHPCDVSPHLRRHTSFYCAYRDAGVAPLQSDIHRRK